MSEPELTVCDELPGLVAVAEAREIRERGEADYLALARRAATGEHVSAEEIDDATRAAGKSLDDFQWLVRNLQQRAEIRKRIDELKQAEAEYDELRNRLGAANAELRQAEAWHAATAGPLEERVIELQRMLGELHVLPTELMCSCPCPALHQRQRLNQQQRDKQNRIGARLREALGALQSDLRYAAEADKPKIKREIMDVEAERRTSDEREAELAAEADEICQAMIDF